MILRLYYAPQPCLSAQYSDEIILGNSFNRAPQSNQYFVNIDFEICILIVIILKKIKVNEIFGLRISLLKHLNFQVVEHLIMLPTAMLP